MYPEDAGADPLPPAPGGGSFQSHAGKNLEGIVPLILIIIVVAFLGQRFGFWQIPFLEQNVPTQMLVIGSPSGELRSVLDEAKTLRLINYRERDAASFTVNPRDQLAQYKIVMLDQSNQADKSISSNLGEALRYFVSTGGKLVVIKNSAIYLSSESQGIASDVVGWRATMGDVVPAECAPGKNSIPTCLTPITIRGIIFRQDFDHEIMEGIEFAPALPDVPPYLLEVFDVTPSDNEIAFVRDVVTGKSYPAITEKTLVVGKAIYFNYDPGKTPEIFKKTLKYLSK